MSSRRPTPLVEVQKVLSLLISDSTQKPFIFTYIVVSFNYCAVRLNGSKVCENTIMGGELVLLNFNTLIS